MEGDFAMFFDVHQRVKTPGTLDTSNNTSAESFEEEDIYGDLESSIFATCGSTKNSKGENNELEKKLAQAIKEINVLQSQNAKLRRENKNYAINVSSLFTTAKSEIEKKNFIIKQLQSKLQDATNKSQLTKEQVQAILQSCQDAHHEASLQVTVDEIAKVIQQLATAAAKYNPTDCKKQYKFGNMSLYLYREQVPFVKHGTTTTGSVEGQNNATTDDNRSRNKVDKPLFKATSSEKENSSTLLTGIDSSESDAVEVVKRTKQEQVNSRHYNNNNERSPPPPLYNRRRSRSPRSPRNSRRRRYEERDRRKDERNYTEGRGDRSHSDDSRRRRRDDKSDKYSSRRNERKDSPSSSSRRLDNNSATNKLNEEERERRRQEMRMGNAKQRDEERQKVVEKQHGEHDELEKQRLTEKDATFINKQLSDADNSRSVEQRVKSNKRSKFAR